MKADQKKEIMDILCTIPGRRLITCMSLIQPVTTSELKKFLPLCFEIFKSNTSFKRSFPNVTNIENFQLKNKLKNERGLSNSEIDRFFPNLFENIHFSNPDRILQKCIDSGLILKIPKKYRTKKNHYLFLNSDILFYFTSKGIDIKFEKKVYPYRHRHTILVNQGSQRKKKENIYHWLALPIKFNELDISGPFDKPNLPPADIDDLLVPLWWFHKHPDLIKKTIREYRKHLLINERQEDKIRNIQKNNTDDKKNYFPYKNRHNWYFTREHLPADWNNSTHLFEYALYEYPIFWEKECSLYSYFIKRIVLFDELIFTFPRFYEILSCFSNFPRHFKEMMKKEMLSPIDLLKKLISENYIIDPLKRHLMIPSIMCITNKKFQDDRGQYKISRLTLKRNSQIIKRTLFYPTGAINKFWCLKLDDMYNRQNRGRALPIQENFFNICRENLCSDAIES